MRSEHHLFAFVTAMIERAPNLLLQIDTNVFRVIRDAVLVEAERTSSGCSGPMVLVYDSVDLIKPCFLAVHVPTKPPKAGEALSLRGRRIEIVRDL